MDLTTRLQGWALGRPRVLVVDGPGTTELRWEVEAELDRRGWTQAQSSAGTDILLAVGPLGDELARAVDVLWSQVPSPRHRAAVGRAPVADELDLAAAALRRPLAQAGKPSQTPAALLEAGRDVGAHHEDQDGQPEPGHHGDHGGGRGQGDHGGGGGHGDHGGGGGQGDHGGGGGHGDHGGGGGHGDHGGGGDHGDHGGDVAGLPMAQTSPDRDGLSLDTLTVRLGPVLPGWPTGLVVRAALQGDVLSEVELTWADAEPATTPAPTDPRLHALDSLQRFLLVAGWPSAAREARAAREMLRSGADPADARRRVDRLARRVARSRALAWSVGGIAPGLGPGGDALDRVRRWCDVAQGGEPGSGGAVTVHELTPVLEGLELAAARLAVASVALRPGPVHSPMTAGAGHG